MTEPDIIPDEVRRLRLEPCDRLIVRTADMRLTHQQVAQYRENLQAVFPDNEVLVIVADEIAVQAAASAQRSELDTDTLDVLDGFINYVQSTDAYPTKDSLGDRRTIECLEHAMTLIQEA